VEKAEDAAARRVPVLGVVDALAFGREERPLSGDRNATGRGLSEVFRRLAAPEEPARWVVGDLNGESYRGYEWGLVAARDAEIVRVPAGPWHPADCVGDLRAAGGALNLLVACRALHKGYAPAPGCIVYGADDGEGRAACRVRPAPAAA